VVESVHLGHVAVCDNRGRLLASAGDPDRVLFARSSMKPLQAAVSRSRMEEELPEEELAIMCASHNGEQVHVAAVLALLRRAGLDESVLRCPPAWPWHAEDARGLEGPARRFHNCSGKHAGMLLAAARRGEQLDTYREPGHPLQQAVLDAVTRLSGQSDLAIGIDGCGVPVHAMSIRAMATLFARVGSPPADESLAGDLGACTGAMRAQPYLVAGRERADTALMQSIPGLVTKGGAEGLACAAVPERSLAVAVRVEDGASRAAAPSLIRALSLLEVLTEAQLEAVGPFARQPVSGGGRPVGALTSTFTFDR
jgi:L-asparaginase II